jgi:hypothetical protein
VELPPIPPEALFHYCPDGYESILRPGEVCGACGWSSTLPLPSLRDCACRLVDVLDGRDGLGWARALVQAVTVEVEERDGRRRVA